MLNQHCRTNPLSTLRSMPSSKQKRALECKGNCVTYWFTCHPAFQGLPANTELAFDMWKKKLCSRHQSHMLWLCQICLCTELHQQQVQVFRASEHQVILLLQILSENIKTLLIFNQRIIPDTLLEVRVQSPHATAHLSYSHHCSRDSSSAGCRADSTQGRKARSRAARHTDAFILKTRFRAKDGLLPLVIEHAVGMLSCNVKRALPCIAGHPPTLRSILSTVRDSPIVMWSPKRHLPWSTAVHRFGSNKLSGRRVYGTVGFRARCGNFAPWSPSNLAMDLPRASPWWSRLSISISSSSVTAMPNPPKS